MIRAFCLFVVATLALCIWGPAANAQYVSSGSYYNSTVYVTQQVGVDALGNPVYGQVPMTVSLPVAPELEFDTVAIVNGRRVRIDRFGNVFDDRRFVVERRGLFGNRVVVRH